MNTCEVCPIKRKARECCGVNPETNAFKFFKFANGERIQVCSELQTDGLCGSYEQRPDVCRVYACDYLYAQGLGSD